MVPWKFLVWCTEFECQTFQARGRISFKDSWSGEGTWDVWMRTLGFCKVVAWTSSCPCVCVLSCFSHVRLFTTLWSTRLLCPWNSPGNNSGVSCHAILQGIFPTQGSNPCLFMFPALAGASLPPCVIWEAQVMPLRSSKNDLVTLLSELGVQPG